MATKYHHGNLRQEVLAAAADLIASRGVDALSMRDLARQAGVSHGAPAHHFGDRRGLLTALATGGFQRLATILEPSVTAEHFDQTAVAYVRFAATHPGHFDVMFRSECLDLQDRDLRAAQQRTSQLLAVGVDLIDDDRLVIDRPDARHAAWSLVHGLAALWLNGVLEGNDLEGLTLAAAHQLFGPPLL